MEGVAETPAQLLWSSVERLPRGQSDNVHFWRRVRFG